jgi:hypothetical protein
VPWWILGHRRRVVRALRRVPRARWREWPCRLLVGREWLPDRLLLALSSRRIREGLLLILHPSCSRRVGLLLFSSSSSKACPCSISRAYPCSSSTREGQAWGSPSNSNRSRVKGASSRHRSRNTARLRRCRSVPCNPRQGNVDRRRICHMWFLLSSSNNRSLASTNNRRMSLRLRRWWGREGRETRGRRRRVDSRGMLCYNLSTLSSQNSSRSSSRLQCLWAFLLEQGCRRHLSQRRLPRLLFISLQSLSWCRMLVRPKGRSLGNVGSVQSTLMQPRIVRSSITVLFVIILSTLL